MMPTLLETATPAAASIRDDKLFERVRRRFPVSTTVNNVETVATPGFQRPEFRHGFPISGNCFVYPHLEVPAMYLDQWNAHAETVRYEFLKWSRTHYSSVALFMVSKGSGKIGPCLLI